MSLAPHTENKPVDRDDVVRLLTNPDSAWHWYQRGRRGDPPPEPRH